MTTLISKISLVLSLSAPLWLLPGCAKSKAGESGPLISAEARKEAEEIFSTRCTTCHGPTGQGDGPASAGLTPKPRNFHDGGWQSGVTDQHLETIIQYGGAAVGKSAAMPANPDLTSKPAVVTALRVHIRDLAK